MTFIAETGAGGHPLWHLALAMVAPVALSAAMIAWQRWLSGTNPVVVVLAAGSVLASGIHAAVCPAHFREATAFGLFFAGSAILQAAWAGLVVARPDRGVLLAGAIGNAAIVLLWIVTRTSGVPFGPRPWHAEAIGSLDLFATIVEAVIAGGALMVMRAPMPVPAPVAAVER